MGARLLFTGVFVLLCLPLFLLPADDDTLENLAVAKALAAALDEAPSSPVHIRWPGTPDAAEQRIRVDSLLTVIQVPAEAVSVEGEVYRITPPDPESPLPVELRVVLRQEAGRLDLHADAPAEGADPVRASVVLGSRLSLFPPLVAIFLAFMTRRTIFSLTLGVLVGAFLLVPAGEAFYQAFAILIQDILVGRVMDMFHLYILGFVLLLSATVAVVTRMGGIEGMVQALVRYAKSSRSVQAVAYFMGLGIFFDDYANTIVVGNSCGPLFDRMKVSRAKLAYVVDSTAAPMAGIAVLSTWVAYQISTYAPQLPTIGRSETEGYSIFLETIPYRFYCIFALVLVGLTIFMRREFGTMRQAEEKARAGDGGPSDSSESMATKIRMAAGIAPKWFNGVIPIASMILATFALIIYYGAENLATAAADPSAAGHAAARRALEEGGMEWLRTVLSMSDSTAAIFYGSLTSLLLAGVMALFQRLLKPKDVVITSAQGIAILFKDAVLILTLAWTIGEVCSDLATANYLVAVFQDLMDPSLLPIILFVTACFVAFSTGSSWTTMAILQPNVVLLADRLGESSSFGSDGLLVLSIGAVLEGAIFGDHCSPISDTTILSSTASRCNHIEHVRTQAPYALLAAVVALVLGYVPTALLGMSPWLSMALGIGGMILFLRLRGRQISESRSV